MRGYPGISKKSFKASGKSSLLTRLISGDRSWLLGRRPKNAVGATARKRRLAKRDAFYPPTPKLGVGIYFTFTLSLSKGCNRGSGRIK